jgi:hypothetical protein
MLSNQERSLQRMKRCVFIFSALVLTMGWTLSACSLPAYHGKYEMQRGGEKKDTLKMLKENWTRYHVSYCGNAIATVAATIFDPKDDDQTLVGDGYITVKDEKSVAGLISMLESQVQFYPQLYEIFDDEGRFYGFVHLVWYRPELKRFDERTLRLPRYESPLYFGRPEGD